MSVDLAPAAQAAYVQSSWYVNDCENAPSAILFYSDPYLSMDYNVLDETDTLKNAQTILILKIMRVAIQIFC